MSGRFLLAIDEGTSSTRTVIYDHQANVVASARQEFTQLYPHSGWVEHNPEEIWYYLFVEAAVGLTVWALITWPWYWRKNKRLVK